MRLSNTKNLHTGASLFILAADVHVRARHQSKLETMDGLNNKLNRSLPQTKSALLSGSPRTKGRAWRRRTTWAPCKYFPSSSSFLSHPPTLRFCKQETRDHPRSAALLLEPRFGRRCEIETTLGGGRLSMPSSGRRTLAAPAVD